MYQFSVCVHVSLSVCVLHSNAAGSTGVWVYSGQQWPAHSAPSDRCRVHTAGIIVSLHHYIELSQEPIDEYNNYL